MGLFTSPHLYRFNERIKVNLKEVPDGELNLCFSSVKELIEEFRLTYFEASLILALEVFKSKRVDVAVFEVGLGGRLDATNALNHNLAVLTNVQIDHTDYLGSSVAEIAEEKAEIFKSVSLGVVGTQGGLVIGAVKKRFKGELFVYGKDFWADGVSLSLEGTEFFYMGSLPLKLSLIGTFQAVNASVAVKAAQVFYERLFGHFLIPREFKVKIPGRFEVLKREPLVVFDVAHNGGALRELFKTALRIGLRGDVYFGGLKDKNLRENLLLVGKYLKESGGRLYLLDTKGKRGLSACELKKLTEGLGLKAEILGKVNVAEIDSPAVITGSFYLGESIERS